MKPRFQQRPIFAFLRHRLPLIFIFVWIFILVLVLFVCNVTWSDSSVESDAQLHTDARILSNRDPSPCATVEEMGEAFRSRTISSPSDMENLRVRSLIQAHFNLHGADNVRRLPPDQFCQQGFVIAKASEAGIGNEMYKILTAAALSIMLNRSLIIGQTRGAYPFENYVSYSNLSLTMKEVKHLWRKNKCVETYGFKLVIRIDDFERPKETNVLCQDWKIWTQPIIWFKGTTDAVGIQFFLKNIHPQMRDVASSLFGKQRANVYGELMRVILCPSQAIKEIVDWALNGGANPDMALHMRMMNNRPVRAKNAALNCVRKALQNHQYQIIKPRIVLVSDTPSFIQDIMPGLMEFSDVIHFDYKSFLGSIPGKNISGQHQLDFRIKDWGPAPRWVAFVDFFLAARAKYAVISGAHRRVGTTYAQLLAALAATNHLGVSVSSPPSNFSFFSSFQSSLLNGGLANQIGWGHVWNRFAGPLSCRNQPHQCAYTPLLPFAWWDEDWQSPISRDIRRLQEYGVQLTVKGKVINRSLELFCKLRKNSVKIIPIIL